VLAGAAPGMTFGEVRHAARKLILRLDPEAARKRKEAARGQAHVRHPGVTLADMRGTGGAGGSR